MLFIYLIFHLFLKLALAVVTLINAIPFEGKKGAAEMVAPIIDAIAPGWGWGSGNGWGERQAAYDINPHFGFRQYSEMRYEPLTTPFMYSTQLAGPPGPQQPLAPIFNGQGPPYSSSLPGPLRGVGLLNGQGGYGGGNAVYDDNYLT